MKCGYCQKKVEPGTELYEVEGLLRGYQGKHQFHVSCWTEIQGAKVYSKGSCCEARMRGGNLGEIENMCAKCIITTLARIHYEDGDPTKALTKLINIPWVQELTRGE